LLDDSDLSPCLDAALGSKNLKACKHCLDPSAPFLHDVGGPNPVVDFIRANDDPLPFWFDQWFDQAKADDCAGLLVLQEVHVDV